MSYDNARDDDQTIENTLLQNGTLCAYQHNKFQRKKDANPQSCVSHPRRALGKVCRN